VSDPTSTQSSTPSRYYVGWSLKRRLRALNWRIEDFLARLMKPLMQWYSRESTQSYLHDVMAISEEGRMNIAKDFNYARGFSGTHFHNHAELVEGGMPYRWLIYGSQKEAMEVARRWERYRDALLARKVSLPKLDGATATVSYRLLMTSHGPIPWRLTLFGASVTVARPEPRAGAYGRDMTTVTLRGALAKEMATGFEELWKACDPQTIDVTPINAAFTRLKTKFLEGFADEYSKDLPIYKLEKSIDILVGTLLLTFALLLIEILYQVGFLGWLSKVVIHY
jgi:hypothetical protein